MGNSPAARPPHRAPGKELEAEVSWAGQRVSLLCWLTVPSLRGSQLDSKIIRRSEVSPLPPHSVAFFVSRALCSNAANSKRLLSVPPSPRGNKTLAKYYFSCLL